jgi:hypothetical protein
MFFNTTGNFNTATGAGALKNNSTSSNNTATGINALLNDTGGQNTGHGANALQNNTSGTNNTAAGFNSLFNNKTGSNDSAYGASALSSNTTGSYNSAVGLRALFSNTTGQINTALGYGAGFNVTTGSNNIEIAAAGNTADNAVIRIGLQGTQTQTFIAGIAGSAVTGSDVVVNGSGKLGVVVSSARYKRDINDMGASTDGLMKLRPVTFVYKGDPQGVKQYGLVAEEVDKVYPELVVHDDAGKVESVRYSMLTSMLLNELQKETRKNEQQAKQIDHLTAQVARQQAAFEQRLAVVERIMAAQNSGGRLQAAFNR